MVGVVAGLFSRKEATGRWAWRGGGREGGQDTRFGLAQLCLPPAAASTTWAWLCLEMGAGAPPTEPTQAA